MASKDWPLSLQSCLLVSHLLNQFDLPHDGPTAARLLAHVPTIDVGDGAPQAVPAIYEMASNLF